MPALLAYHNVNSPSTGTATLTTPTITPTVGDLIVVKGATYGSGEILNTPTDTQGNTYTSRGTVVVGGRTWLGIWTTLVGTGAAMTVSVTVPDACDHSITVERWNYAALDVTPIINGTKTGTGTPQSTIETSQAYSAVTWVNGDTPGQDPVSRSYDTTSANPAETGLHDTNGGGYVAYYAWQPATSAGTQIFGLTSPGSQSWALLGMEILNVVVGTDPEQAYVGPLAWQ